MPGRPHKERLLSDLNEIRAELSDEVSALKPEEFDWAPAPEMKTYKGLLLEIGTMETLGILWLRHRKTLGWKEAEQSLGWVEDEAKAALKVLDRARAETLAYLNACSEEQLQNPVPLPEDWKQYWGTCVEPEELLRWIARHEYYHLGQIISYRWIQGHNPYKQT